METIQIYLSNRLLVKIKDCELEPSEVISIALDRYFNNIQSYSQLLNWQNYIEQKLRDLQNQLDEHRKRDTNDLNVEFDNDLRERSTGEKSCLDLPSYSSVKVENITYAEKERSQELAKQKEIEPQKIDLLL